MDIEINELFTFIDSENVNILSENPDRIQFEETGMLNNLEAFASYKLEAYLRMDFKIAETDVRCDSIEELEEMYDGHHSESPDKLVIKVTYNKKDIFAKYNEYSNFYFFTEHSKAMDNIDKLVWSNTDEKMIILIKDIPNKLSLNTPYLIITELEQIQTKSLDVVIKEKDKVIYDEMNLYYERAKFTSYLELPTAWMSREKVKNSVYVVKQIYLLMKMISVEANDNVFTIRGYKTVKIKINEATIDSMDKVETINSKIFSFLKDNEKFYDKKIILRNTLTIYLNDDSTTLNYLRNCEEIYRSVEYNYNLYI
ncbi:hypothetical protein HBP99_05660, partial [Listeria booriae]|uniref:hypothetical protein n=1 Tax=Listeria booriae TaxID=1552123 RepID=UPI0016274DF5